LVGGSSGVSPQELAVRMPAYWSKTTTAFTNPPKKSAPWSGLAGLDLGRHIRYSLWWMWGFSLVLFAVAWALGMF